MSAYGVDPRCLYCAPDEACGLHGTRIEQASNFLPQPIDTRASCRILMYMNRTALPTITTGAEMLHYRPSTGRIIRIVRVVEIKGDAIIVEATNGKNKGERYPVGRDALAEV